MSKLIFSGYPDGGLHLFEDGLHVTSPKNSPSRELEKDDRAFFIAHYHLLWEGRKTIFSIPEMYNTPLKFSALSCAYIGGEPLSLGILLELWENGNWTVPCPECEGICRVLSWGGSPLSGSNSWRGFCTESGANFSGSVHPPTDGIFFSKEAIAAIKLIKKHRKPVVVKTPPVYSDFLTFSRRCTERYGRQGNKIPKDKPVRKEMAVPEDNTKTLREVIEFLDRQRDSFE